MALKNKPGTFWERYLNNRNVNMHRILVLKINYLKGLAVEYEKKYDQFMAQEEKYIESYYQEDVSPLNTQIDGKTKADAKREKLIKRFEEKAYWQRRKVKTKYMRKMDKEQVNKEMLLWDEKQKENHDLFIEKVNEKYPHEFIGVEASDLLKKKIEKLDEKKEKQLELMQKRGKRLKENIQSFLEKNTKKIARMENRNKTLVQKITDYNQSRLKKDQVILSRLKSEQDQLFKNEASTKKLEKITHDISKIETIMKIIGDDSIHLSVKNLKMYFGGVKAINDLSFDVKKGEIFGLIGPNGAGKTTIFNCITQFYKATSGDLILRNKENHVVDLAEYKTHDMIKEGIARSFQNVELIWELTVLDNLMVAAHSLLITSFYDHMAHTRKLIREDSVIRTKGYQILQNLGIEAYAFRSPYGLPYGVLKKVELARTLMTDPSLIILDEPAAGLNDAETQDLAKVIQKINKEYGITIFLVEHDMGLVMSICDRVCAISFGKLIGLGTTSEIQSNPEVRKAYLGDDTDE